MDSNREIEAPVVGDIASSIDLMLCKMEPFNIRCGEAWMNSINAVKQVNAEKMQKKLTTPTEPMNYFNALKVVADVLQDYTWSLSAANFARSFRSAINFW